MDELKEDLKVDEATEQFKLDEPRQQYKFDERKVKFLLNSYFSFEKFIREEALIQDKEIVHTEILELFKLYYGNKLI